MSTYIIQRRQIPWWAGRKYRVACVDSDGNRDGFYEFFTLRGAERWVSTTQWADIPWTPRDYETAFGATTLRNTMAKAWAEGYLAGDPHQRRGDPAKALNPYRDEAPTERQAH